VVPEGVEPEVVVVVVELEEEGLAVSGALNFPLSNPKADIIISTTIAIKINPIKHIRNLSVYTYLEIN